MAKDTPLIAGYKFRNNLQSLFLILSLITLLAGIGWLVASSQAAVFILLAGFIVFNSLHRFSPCHLLHRVGARQLHKADAPGLIECIEHLSRDAGLEKPPLVYQSNQGALNAFTLKLHQQHAIVISEALIEHLDEDETRAVLAHEISHIYHDDVSVMLIACRLAQLTQCLTALALVMMAIMPMLNLQNIPVPWQVIICLLMAYYVSGLLQLSLSRVREFYADVIAVQLTRDVPAMVSALKKIEQGNSNWLVSLIRAPVRASLLQEHPPTQDRIRHLLGLEMLSGFTAHNQSK